jgi:DNA-binding response OmpR family regulator
VSSKPDTVLVVDDTPTNLGMLFDGLRAAGYRVLLNEDGQTALKTSEKVLPDLIILDVMMPGMDGFEVCRRLKSDSRTQSIPVIFMTALSDPVDEVHGLRLGAVDYIIKPINIETVLARLHTHLTLRNLRRALEIKNAELQEALSTIKTLSGIVPICAWCGKNIRNEQGEWVSVISYLRSHADVEFTHTLCPGCYEQVNAELDSI